MAGTLPVAEFVKITMTSVQPGQTTISVSGRRQTRQYATQYWQFDCDYRVLQRSDAAQVMAFLGSQRNNLLDFSITLPEFSDTQGTVTQMLAANASVSPTLTVSSNTAIGSSTVAVGSAWRTANFSAAGVSANTALKAGDFVTFSNHNKIYQLTSDVSVNGGTGAATLNLYPALIGAVTTTTTVNYTDVAFNVFLREGNQAYDFGLGDTSAISLKLQESF